VRAASEASAGEVVSYVDRRHVVLLSLRSSRPSLLAQPHLTPLLATSSTAECLHLESKPGKEDWHRADCGVSWVKRFWGAQCLHWTGENWSEKSRVSLDFRIIPNGGDGGELYDSDEGYYGFARKDPDGIWRLEGGWKGRRWEGRSRDWWAFRSARPRKKSEVRGICAH